MRLKCPSCESDDFNIHIPTPTTEHFLRFDYVICAKCGKLWTLKPDKDEPTKLYLKEGLIK